VYLDTPEADDKEEQRAAAGQGRGGDTGARKRIWRLYRQQYEVGIEPLLL
jgi:hypothetical protein